VTWCHARGNSTMFGWALPDLDPNANHAHGLHLRDYDSDNDDMPAFPAFGSFISAANGELCGLGRLAIKRLPQRKIPTGASFALRYDPAQRTMHVSVNGSSEILCFTTLRQDLVPAVILAVPNDSCTILDG
jgi:hypothetical protein